MKLNILAYNIKYTIVSFFAKKIIESEERIEKNSLKSNLTDLAEIRMVLSHNRVHTAIACLTSFYRMSGHYLECYIHSDGSLTDKDKILILKHVPWVHFHEITSFDKRFLSKYPNLALLEKYWYGKKLVSTHYMRNKKKKLLILDDDLLFFKKPTKLINWISSGKNNLLMEDYEYCYSISAVETKACLDVERIETPLNTGLFGCVSSFSFSDMERIVRVIHDVLGQRVIGRSKHIVYASTHLIEQTVYSILLSKRKKTVEVLPKSEYVVYGFYYYNILDPIQKDALPTLIHFAGDPDKFNYYKHYLWLRFLTHHI